MSQTVSNLRTRLSLDLPIDQDFPDIQDSIQTFLKTHFSIFKCSECGSLIHHAICAYFNGHIINISLKKDNDTFAYFIKHRKVEYNIQIKCYCCSLKEHRENGKEINQIEYLRRFPVNIGFIKKKMDFQQFLEWKKDRIGSFHLE